MGNEVIDDAFSDWTPSSKPRCCAGVGRSVGVICSRKCWNCACLLTAVTMTNQEQLLLELVNRARANPAAEAFRYGIDLNKDLDPDTISAESKQPLSPHQALINAAGAHAQDMLDFDYFEHVNLRGEGPADRARAAGYPAGAGENIAWYGAGPRLDKTGEVYARHEALFLSPPHRKNMMTPGYRELGTGIRYGEYEGLYSIMVAEEFGNRGGEFFVTGVAYTDEVVRDNFYSVGEGIGSITVTATRHRDGQTFTTTTGPSGGYGLQVPAGVYRVTASGPRLTSPVTVQDVAILSSNQKVDFNTRVSGLGSLSGQVFDDRDRDGTRDAGEGPLAGQTIYLDSDDNGERSPDETSIQSDASGNFRWDGLRSGTYQVRVEAAPGWQASAPSSGLYSGSLSPGQSVTGLLFGAYLVNASPVARPDQFQTEQGQSVTVDVFANDSDADGTLMPETTRIVVSPQHGDVRLDRGSGKLVFFPVAGYVGSDFFDYTVDDDGGLTSNVARVQLQMNPGPGLAWQNPANKFDVNGDTFMSSIDALLILNDINAQGARRLTVPQAGVQPPPYIDVSGDGFTTSLDALLVLNELNRIFTRPRNAQKAEARKPKAKPRWRRCHRGSRRIRPARFTGASDCGRQAACHRRRAASCSRLRRTRSRSTAGCGGDPRQLGAAHSVHHPPLVCGGCGSSAASRFVRRTLTPRHMVGPDRWAIVPRGDPASPDQRD